MIHKDKPDGANQKKEKKVAVKKKRAEKEVETENEKEKKTKKKTAWWKSKILSQERKVLQEQQLAKHGQLLEELTLSVTHIRAEAEKNLRAQDLGEKGVTSYARNAGLADYYKLFFLKSLEKTLKWVQDTGGCGMHSSCICAVQV